MADDDNGSIVRRHEFAIVSAATMGLAQSLTKRSSPFYIGEDLGATAGLVGGLMAEGAYRHYRNRHNSQVMGTIASSGTIQGQPVGNMAGYNNTPSAYIQPASSGYENTNLIANKPRKTRTIRTPRSYVPNFNERFLLRRHVSPESSIRADQDMQLNDYLE